MNKQAERQGRQHDIRAKIALNQKLTEYERCYFLLFGKWEEVHKFLKKEKSIHQKGDNQ